MLDTHAKKYFKAIFSKLADLFIRIGLSANAVTILALIIGVGASITVYFDYNRALSVGLLWVSGLFDALDGTIARKTKSTPLGTVLDIVGDRVVEACILIALVLRDPSITFHALILYISFNICMTIFLIVGSQAENSTEKSFYYQAGLTERTETFLFFTLMILFPPYVTKLMLVFAILVFITAGQRMYEAVKILK